MGVGVMLGTILVAGLADRAINSVAIGNGQTAASSSLATAFTLLDDAFQRLVDPAIPLVAGKAPSTITVTPPSLAPAPGAAPTPIITQTPST